MVSKYCSPGLTEINTAGAGGLTTFRMSLYLRVPKGSRIRVHLLFAIDLDILPPKNRKQGEYPRPFLRENFKLAMETGLKQALSLK